MIKRILITGANKGIGLATVAAILEQHHDAEVLLGSRNLDNGNAARSQLIVEHPDWENRVQVLQIDVSSEQSVASAADLVREKYGIPALYAVVNNAGTGFGDYPMQEVLEVYFWSQTSLRAIYSPPAARCTNSKCLVWRRTKLPEQLQSRSKRASIRQQGRLAAG